MRYSEQHNCLRTTTWTVTQCGIERMYCKQLSADKRNGKKSEQSKLKPQFPGSTFASANSSAVAVCRPASTHCTHYTSSLQNIQSAPERQQEEPCFRSASRQKRKCVRTAWERRKMTNSTKMCPYRPARPDVAQYKRHRTTLSALGIHALAQDICS